ncbi:MAG: TlpA family protein disulfide reductase [Acidimicrobiia bacterium]|nr:TlpA family protein disulfide reductase [Acidimicrobiia bacterium]
MVVGVVATGVAILVGVIVAAVVLKDDGASGEASEGSFDLPALEAPEGERVTLADYEGTPVVVNFFASWCPTCDQELPDFNTAADEYAGEVEFVFVNALENADWKPMAERNGILDNTLAKDVGPDNNELYLEVGGAVGLPITAFYDAEGDLVHTELQGMTLATLQEQIRQSFGVAPA